MHLARKFAGSASVRVSHCRATVRANPGLDNAVHPKQRERGLGMPRIPVRVEPYSSPSKQHRHYKSKRDQVIRALGKAAYINGSQFALLLVSARGDVETFASDALQGRMDDWFVKSGIADEARSLAQRSTEAGPSTLHEAEELAEKAVSDNTSASRLPDDPFLDSWDIPKSDAPQTTDWSLLQQDTSLDDSHSLLEPSTVESINESPSLTQIPRMSTPVTECRSTPGPKRAPMQHVAANAHQPHCIIQLRDEAMRTAFMKLRFGQLQQVMCKMVAKEWIKVIEPKKQTRYPYNRGEEAKPPWWPASVRHKEPDHLMKPERHELLLAILRLSQMRIARLQLATAEIVAHMKPDKVSLLMDVYRVAREEEKLRDEGKNGDTPVQVGVCSVKGWDAIQGVVTVVDIVGSAGEVPVERPRATPRLNNPELLAAWSAGPLNNNLQSPVSRAMSQASPEPTSPMLRSSSLPCDARMQDKSMPPPATTTREVPSASAREIPGGYTRYPPELGRHFAQNIPNPMPVETSQSHTLPAAAIDSHLPSLVTPMVQSPMQAQTHTLMVPYTPGHADGVRAPMGNQPMKSTRSAPMPHTPDTWAMRPPLQQQIRLETGMTHAQLDARAWMQPMAYTNTSGTWIHDNSTSTRSGVPVGMSPAGEVRFSPSFDSSFSSNGPMTPGSLSHLSVALPAASHGGAHSLSTHEPIAQLASQTSVPMAPLGHSASTENPFAAKHGNALQFSNIPEWSRH